SPSATRNITKEKNPNMSKAQAPSDMGDQVLSTGAPVPALKSMCQKSSGLPRSRVSKMGQMSSSGRLIRKAIREATQSAARPHSRSIVPMTNAPPARPAKKKYRRMYHSQFGGMTKCSLGMRGCLAATAECDQAGNARDDSGDNGREVARNVVAAGQHGALRTGQLVGLRLVGEKEEGVQPAVFLVAVDAGFADTLLVQGAHPVGSHLTHLAERSELNRLSRAGGGARRLQIVLQPVVAEGALLGGSGVAIEADHAIGAGGDAVAAAVADVLLDVDGVELGANDRVGRADLQAAGVRAVLAHVGHHRPGDRLIGALGGLFHKANVAPVGMVELAGVVVTVAELERVVRKLIPFLAGDLARLAPDAQGCVREESHRLRHRLVPHQVGRDFRQSLVAGIQVERQTRELIDDRNGAAVTAKVKGQQVAPAGCASIDAGVWKPFCLLVDRQAG